MAAPSDKKSKPEASNPAADEKATCTFEDAGRCFKDTNLLILGSGTSRHWFFVLQDVLTHNETRTTGSRSDFVSVLSPRRRYATGYREHEKNACGGGKLFAITTSHTLLLTLPQGGNGAHIDWHESLESIRAAEQSSSEV